MENKILRCGVVGAGRGAAVAACGFGNKKCKIVAACDKNEVVLAHCKEYFESMDVTDVIYLSDYDELLKMDIDAVIVATEAVYHVPRVKKALEAGKHVLSEIPSITNLEEAYEVCVGASKVFINCLIDAKSALQKSYSNIAGYNGELDLLKTSGTILTLAQNLYETMMLIRNKKDKVAEDILTEDK